MEVLDMLVAHLESKTCRDQVFLLMYEPQAADMLYCLLTEKHFTMELKQRVLKVSIANILLLLFLIQKVVISCFYVFVNLLSLEWITLPYFYFKKSVFHWHFINNYIILL